MKDPSTETSNVASQAQPFSAGGNGYSHKVRKPYVITKQREKWTANEHQRFVEALKLYGRGWRQIEEYVGTKTAIQIRSHAQKFFAKVSRDTGACGEGLLNLEDIPPPRPKKKPLHPYPRKTENKEDTDSNALECLTDDGEKYSPSSVASAVNSDNVESAVAEMHSSCPSPTSCATDALSGNLLTSANFSAVPPGDNLIKKSHQDSESTMESPFCAGQRTSFKLFGKTVVVVNGAGQSSDVMGSSESRPESPDDQLVHGFIPPLPTASPPYPPQANNNDLKRDQSAWYYSLLHPCLPGTAAADFNTMLTNTPIQIRDGV